MVSRETLLLSYIDLVRHWGRTINLASRQQADTGWFERQVETSLALVPHLPQGLSRFIDLGSGQGLPAIPMAIASGVAVDLVESDRRKAAFLTTVLSKLHLAGKVWPTRIETAHIAPSLCITAQALAPLSELVALARPLLQVEGCCLFPKGPSATAEMHSLRDMEDCRAELIPLTPLSSYLVKVTRLR